MALHSYSSICNFKIFSKKQKSNFDIYIEYEKHAIEKIVSRKVLLSLTSKNSWHYINDVKIFSALKQVFSKMTRPSKVKD